MSMKVTAGCSLPPRLFLLERKKNRVECIVFTVLFGEMFQKSVYFSWLLLLSVAPPFNGTFFHPFFTRLFSCPSSSIPTYGTDWLTESLMIHHAERSTRQRASGQITSNFQFRESCIYQTDFTLALVQKWPSNEKKVQKNKKMTTKPGFELFLNSRGSFSASQHIGALILSQSAFVRIVPS